MDRTILKVLLTAILAVTGGGLAVLSTPQDDTEYSSGIILDFGDYDIKYLGLEDGGTDARDAIGKLCDYYSIVTAWNGGSLTSVDGRPASGDPDTWALWVTEKGSVNWHKWQGDPEDVSVGDYSAVAWALRQDGEVPTPGVDATGVTYYGHQQAYRIVSMAPSCTETLCAAGAGDLIVGTDSFSNYPSYIEDRHASGEVAEIGGYTNPSYESVAKLNPDAVFAVEGQATQEAIVGIERGQGVNCVVLYDGDTIETIMDNTWIAGAAINYGLKSAQVNEQISEALQKITDALAASSDAKEARVAISLSSAKSPWVAGGSTYASDVISFCGCTNVFSSLGGWVQVNSEKMAEYDPEYIIVVTSDITNTDGDYDDMVSSLSAEWKSTSAYRNGDVYLLTDGATDLASRPSTRIAQFTELLCRIVQPDVLGGDDLPKHIGSEYEDYLTITSELGFRT